MLFFIATRGGLWYDTRSGILITRSGQEFTMKSRVINPTEAKIIEEHLEDDMLKLLCQIMRVAGLRVSDACGLKYSDINDNVLFVVEQKTGKSKRVVLPLWLVNAVNTRRVNYPDEEYIFVSAYNRKCGKDKPVSRRHVLNAIQEAAKAGGVEGQISPHSFRKCAAAEVYECSGGNAFTAQRFLNHSSVGGTVYYLPVEDYSQEDIDYITGHIES